MEPVDLVAAGAVLAVSLGFGMVAHELSHALTLRALGVTCDIEWLPDTETVGLVNIGGSFATVTPRAVPADLPPWRLRIAALMPLTLAVPIPLVIVGVLPDPLAGGDPLVASAAIGWLACGLPSPQDFSLVWHAEAAIERYADSARE